MLTSRNLRVAAAGVVVLALAVGLAGLVFADEAQPPTSFKYFRLLNGGPKPLTGIKITGTQGGTVKIKPVSDVSAGHVGEFAHNGDPAEFTNKPTQLKFEFEYDGTKYVIDTPTPEYAVDCILLVQEMPGGAPLLGLWVTYAEGGEWKTKRVL